jgi:hypothetical protein
MARTAATFRQRDVTRAVRATLAAGVKVSRIEIDPVTGKIVIVSGTPEKAAETEGEANEWDRA